MQRSHATRRPSAIGAGVRLVTKRHRSALGFTIAQLKRGNVSAGDVVRDLFGDSELGRALTRAVRHGSLIDGSIQGPRYYLGGVVHRSRALGPECDDLKRSLDGKAAARLVACALMFVERMDPDTGKASGRALWQGRAAMRLGLSTRKGSSGTLGGVREVQRYVRILARADVLQVVQPNADNVPAAMRGARKRSIVRGVESDRQWAYNVYRAQHSLPLPIRDALRAWRGQQVTRAQPPTHAPIVIAPELAALDRPPQFGACVAAARATST